MIQTLLNILKLCNQILLYQMYKIHSKYNILYKEITLKYKAKKTTYISKINYFKLLTKHRL